MRVILPDLDLYVADIRSTPCTICHGDMGKCNGGCNGSISYSLKPRDPAEVNRIKEGRQKKHDLEVLREAAAIIARIVR